MQSSRSFQLFLLVVLPRYSPFLINIIFIQSPLYCALHYIYCMHRPAQSDLGPQSSSNRNELFPYEGMPRFGPGSTLLRITQPTENRNRPPSGVTTRRAELQTGSQRLKLKDYLHLASMEKKSKSRSLRPDSRIDSKSNASYQLKRTTEQSVTMNGQADMDELIRQDIDKRIEEQLKHLQDLQQFVRRGSQVVRTTNQKNILLFGIYNTLKTNGQALDQVGEKIYAYEGQDRGKQPYYWRQNKQQRESPAKILKKGLEMTYNLTTILNPQRRVQ